MYKSTFDYEAGIVYFTVFKPTSLYAAYFSPSYVHKKRDRPDRQTGDRQTENNIPCWHCGLRSFDKMSLFSLNNAKTARRCLVADA